MVQFNLSWLPCILMLAVQNEKFVTLIKGLVKLFTIGIAKLFTTNK